MVEVGQIARGTVVRVLPYGALVRLDDGCLGLVHISEIDERFVHNVNDYVAPEARVVVKVLQFKDGGKYEFSIKQAKGVEIPETTPEEFDVLPQHDFDWTDQRSTRAAFDEKLRDFLTDAGERMNDIRRHTDSKLHRRAR